jgi:hypothetical protein
MERKVRVRFEVKRFEPRVKQMVHISLKMLYPCSTLQGLVAGWMEYFFFFFILLFSSFLFFLFSRNQFLGVGALTAPTNSYFQLREVVAGTLKIRFYPPPKNLFYSD